MSRPPSSRRRPARRPPRRATSATPARRRRVFATLGIAALVLLVGAAVAAGGVYASVSRDLPDPTHPLKGTDQTTKVYDRNGLLIADLFAEQNRTVVPLKDMPPSLSQAAVATEDERFYRHGGVDPLGILRAFLVDVTTGTQAQGGSTITQQYVKNAFVTDERTLRRKAAEAVLAYRVERNFSKDKILEMYLNTIYFGHGAYGVQAASQVYFGKSVGSLSLAESAMLAGVIKSPGRFSPYLDPAAAKARRRVVLGQMLAQGYIRTAAHDQAVSSSVRVAGLKPRGATAPYFVEWVKNDLVTRFGAGVVYRGGLKVKTSLDLNAQRAAESAVKSTLGRKGDPAAALVAVDPKTGEVRAMVGGGDFGQQQYNLAVQGRRQPGSAFKPFVLVAALRKAISPEATFEAGPVALDTGSGTLWKVTGAGGDVSGPMRLRVATEKSVNSVFAQLVMKVGPDAVVKAAKDLGITTPVRPVPAIALGGLEQGVSPLEMASAYATLAEGGMRTTPHGILTVADPAGHALFTASSTATRTVDGPVAYLTTDMLKGVVARGTGTAADIGRPAAGKTGTTQQYRDAWFAGYTPDLAAAVWVGYPDSQRAMDSVHGRKVTGGSFPAGIWSTFMKAALKDTPADDFTRPAGLSNATICLDTGLLATTACPRRGGALFLTGGMPATCTLHPVATHPSNPATATPPSHPTGGGKPSDTAPVARFVYAAGSGKDASRIAFDGAQSLGTGLRYAWRFGDGTSGDARFVRHTYERAGHYTVLLTVTDAKGRTDSVSKRIRIR